jgi:hypothetical protein
MVEGQGRRDRVEEPPPARNRGHFLGAGFIWGGKWNHFFHFEYRPQIIALAKQGWPGK